VVASIVVVEPVVPELELVPVVPEVEPDTFEVDAELLSLVPLLLAVPLLLLLAVAGTVVLELVVLADPLVVDELLDVLWDALVVDILYIEYSTNF
jgi:hypothetical protein